MTDASIIDFKLATELAGGSEELAKELLQMLVSTLPEYEFDIDKHTKNNDVASLAEVAHKLHGAACYTGTPRLKEAAKHLEHTAKQNATDDLDEATKNLLSEIDTIKISSNELWD